MKTNTVLLNSLGFINAAQKCAYAAWVLDACTLNNPVATISPALAAIPAKAAILAQTAKPMRPGTPKVLAAENTIGYAFGELYLNSPAYPIGTAIPPIPPKPASAAVLPVPGTPLIPAVAKIEAPEVKAIKGWDMAIDIIPVSESLFEINAYLPISQNISAIGGNIAAVGAIGEITPNALSIAQWVGEKASNIPTEIVASDEPKTLEQYFYKYARQLVAEYPENNSIENIIYTVAGIPTACKFIRLRLAANEYDLQSSLLQLSKLANTTTIVTPPRTTAPLLADLVNSDMNSIEINGTGTPDYVEFLSFMQSLPNFRSAIATNTIWLDQSMGNLIVNYLNIDPNRTGDYGYDNLIHVTSNGTNYRYFKITQY